MTVKQLSEWLHKCPEDAEVIFGDCRLLILQSGSTEPFETVRPRREDDESKV